MKALLPLLVVFCACAVPDFDVDRSAAGGKADGLLAPVFVIDGDEYSKTLACSGLCVNSYHIWLDLAVLDSAYEKRVGIVWTADDWHTTNTALASYEGELDESYDQWGVDVKVVDADIKGPQLVQVAAFAEVGGVEHWDSQNDHYFYGPGPVSGVELDSANFAQFPCSGGSGVCAADLRIKAKVHGPVNAESVVLRWSRDNWASFNDTELSSDESATEPYAWSGSVDLRTESEKTDKTFDPQGPIFYKLYATSHGKIVWEAGENHRLF
jgi:hypothetical protein